MSDQKQIQGKTYWRSLEQLADTLEFRQFLESEYPEHAAERPESFSRRSFISRKTPSRCSFFFSARRAWSTLLSRTCTCTGRSQLLSMAGPNKVTGRVYQ